MSGHVLEICVDDAPGLEAAVAGGADRIELCAALALGGLTPTPGLMARAASAPIPVYAMIRPRAGDFVFERAEIETMEADIEAVRGYGLAGVVLGASLPDGRLDRDALARLADRAAGLGKTLHRAFDLVPDFAEAVDTAVALGFERILTSGGEPNASDSPDTLRRIVELADGRISIMPGAGITAENAHGLIAATGVSEVHASAGSSVGRSTGAAVRLGFESPQRRGTDPMRVAALRHALDGLPFGPAGNP